jgi:hypothetical protein
MKAGCRMYGQYSIQLEYINPLKLLMDHNFFFESGYKNINGKVVARDLWLLIGLFPKKVYTVAAKADAKDNGK